MPNGGVPVFTLIATVVTYGTEASNQKSKYAYRKIFFYKKALTIGLIHTHTQYTKHVSPTAWAGAILGDVLTSKCQSPYKTTPSLKAETRIKREIGYILCKVHMCGNGQ